MFKKMFRKIKNKFHSMMAYFAVKAQTVVCNCKAEGYLDTAVLILISIVLGALLLAGLYALFNDVVLPRINTEITDMFNYAG